MKSVVNLNSKGFPWRDMTENMQAAGLEADHAAAKPKKTKKTAAAAADFALLRRDQERWLKWPMQILKVGWKHSIIRKISS